MTVVNPKSISGITSITTASGSDNLLTIHTNNGTERLRIDSTGATKIVTGIVTTLTATTGIVTTLTANTVTSLGAVSGTTGTFTGAVSGTTGTFTSDVDIADKIVHTGDTNTAIRFPAADTITAETGGSERLRITSDGNVGINDNNPDNQLVVKSVSGHTTAKVTSSDETTSMVMQAIQGSEGRLGMNTNHPLAIYAGGLERLRINTSGQLGLNTDTPDTTFTIKSGGDVQMSLKNASGTTKAYFGTDGAFGSAGTDDLRIRSDSSHIIFGFSGTEKVRMLSGGGITFNGDTAAANALDDYEEGTWTPTVSDGGAAFSTTNASYVKIAKMVFISFDITNNSGGNIYQVFGLPFAVAKYAAFNLAWVSNNQQGAQGASDIQGGLITTSTNQLGFRVDGGNNSQNVANNVRFIGSGAYETS